MVGRARVPSRSVASHSALELAAAYLDEVVHSGSIFPQKAPDDASAGCPVFRIILSDLPVGYCINSMETIISRMQVASGGIFMNKLGAFFRATGIGVLLNLVCMSPSYGQTVTWVTNARLVQLEPAAGGWVWVRLQNGLINCSGVGGPSTDQHPFLHNVAPLSFASGAFDRIYGTLMTAFATGTSVDLAVTGSSDGARCLIERVRLRSN